MRLEISYGYSRLGDDERLGLYKHPIAWWGVPERSGEGNGRSG
ncbi:MAG: hypothetical protein R2864_10770 [Syntrophotaleaceae bacterium]